MKEKISDTYQSKAVLNKTAFNLIVQIIPILIALSFTPSLIEGLTKDGWAKYSVGISLIFLSNYFSFGIGPALNRQISKFLSEPNYKEILSKLNYARLLAFLLGVFFFFLMLVTLSTLYINGSISLLSNYDDLIFYSLMIFTFLIVFFMIPLRSFLEAVSDFFFLSIVRAIISSFLFLAPFFFIGNNTPNLYQIGIVLLIFYALIYLIFYLRVQMILNKIIGQKSELLINLIIKSKNIIEILKSDKQFISESFYFSLFFISSAFLLYFDRFLYSSQIDTVKLADHVTLLDLYNRVAILTGTISLVYFSAISFWYNSNQLIKLKKSIKLQLSIVSLVFFVIISFSYFYLNDLLAWWLKLSFSDFIEENSLNLLIAVLIYNFTILLIRPLQAIGEIKIVMIILLVSTFVYAIILFILNHLILIEYHYIAILVKSIIDIILLFILAKKRNIL